MTLRSGLILVLLLLGVTTTATTTRAQSRFLEVRYTPTTRAQIAIWIERADGTFLRTLLLTEAVGSRGIGNRPGALQMNSGFRWPYGRREGVLPIWAHRRAMADGAAQFPRIVFQNRIEGYASQTSSDQSKDDYFCLSFNDSNNENVDATTCASVFNSDKGRYMTPELLQAGYAEPFQYVAGTTSTRTLSITSLYPMRRDILAQKGFDSPDVLSFASTARAVMPEIDVVTRATAPADAPQIVGYEIPDTWPDGDYVVFVEVNTERDFNDSWTEAMHPTPAQQNGAWDYWAANYGYAYRGQPSVLFSLKVRVELVGSAASAELPVGYGSLEGLDGSVTPLDATISDVVPGSGLDRLRVDNGARLRLATMACDTPPPVPAIPWIEARAHDDEDHSHEWGTIEFEAVTLTGRPVTGYRVKISPTPITDDTTFVQAEDAKAATTDFQGLELCPVDPATGAPGCPAAGTTVSVDIGKLSFLSTYYVAIRATGPCGALGPISATRFETTAINFTTVAPCFVATAAYGSPMADDVATLRAFRDRRLVGTDMGRRFVDAYYRAGPVLAETIRGHTQLRALARAVLRPFVQLAELTNPRR